MSAMLNDELLHSKMLPDLVTKLLVARQENLVLFNKLASLKPFSSVKLVQHVLQRFRQSLIDYLALGPFEVYEALEEQPTDSPYRQARKVARQLYAPLAETTQVALDFHDRYEGEVSSAVLAELDDELSRLGEQLAERIALEDMIVTAIRNSSKLPVAA